MTLVELLYAGLQLQGKCMKLDCNYQKDTVNYVVTGFLTPMEGVIRTVKTDLRGVKIPV